MIANVRKDIQENYFGAAVFGLGGMGATHVRAAQDSPFIDRVIGYEPGAERAAMRGGELGIEATADLESILRNPVIQLVYIASPNSTHCNLTIQALRAGKAVLCEKPMSTSLEEAQLMLQVQKETGSFLQIGFELRYSKLYLTAKRWIEAGLIGRPLNSHCDYNCCEFIRRGSWRNTGATTLIGEKLCHYLDLPRWWFNDEVEEVFSAAAPNAISYFNHPDNHQIYCRHRGGAISTLTFFMHTAETFAGDPLSDAVSQQVDDGHRLTYLLYGTRGAIELDVFRRRARRWEFTDKPDGLNSHLTETVSFPPEEDKQWYHNVHGQNLRIAELVAQQLPAETSPADSYESMRVVFAADQSERERRPVRLDASPAQSGNDASLRKIETE